MKKDKQLEHLRDIVHILDWIIDKEEGELIESEGYTKDYLNVVGYHRAILQDELDSLCKDVNVLLDTMNCTGLRVANRAGEIIPAYKKIKKGVYLVR